MILNLYDNRWYDDLQCITVYDINNTILVYHVYTKNTQDSAFNANCVFNFLQHVQKTQAH